MDRFDEINAFAAVADARSFTQGARRLGVSSAQVSKLVARLENRLGARLLNRTTRDVSLTDTGRAYLERARNVLDDFEALEGSVRDQSGPKGLLKISAPVSFGASQLTPALLDFAAAYPEVSLDVSATDRMVSLVEEGFDVGVRIGELGDSSLIARKLAAVRMVTCASPGYLQAAGAPATPDDLAKHEAILDNNMRDPTVWSYGGHADRHDVRVHGRLKFGGADACVAAARRGLGVTRTPAFAAAEDLRAGRLVPLLCAYEVQVIHVHAVYPHARHLAAKVRVFVDFLAARYAGEPEWHLGWGEAKTSTR
ncbi:LysR family transcriptional regulator [Phenylobacterium sp.]|uniref:LysR family transcriptional regulator n=1 Tax=Phenylobacterium sp. TaxID=1871053 RepID=UPI0012037715|nr:LysR family transcriptional regulator [Phenylobacterium sp.]THD63313.1 MAG: LysR family transcriptional regulator [Phenylobacterium sp.]